MLRRPCARVHNLYPHIRTRLQIHARITTSQLREILAPVIYAARRAKSHRFTVFFDEVNTASILGVIQTIMVDRRLDGAALPPNIFWAAAANPYRRRSGNTDEGGEKVEECAPHRAASSTPIMRRLADEHAGDEGEAKVGARRDLGDTPFEDWCVQRLTMRAAAQHRPIGGC